MMNRIRIACAALCLLAALGGCAGRNKVSEPLSNIPAGGGATAGGSTGAGVTAAGRQGGALASRERSMLVRATAYTSTRAQTDGTPHDAAWGDRLHPGTPAIAVSPDLIRLGLTPGTGVRIEGIPGRFTVLDKTNGRMRRHIDIYMGQDTIAARRFGRKSVRIYWWGTASPARRQR